MADSPVLVQIRTYWEAVDESLPDARPARAAKPLASPARHRWVLAVVAAAAVVVVLVGSPFFVSALRNGPAGEAGTSTDSNTTITTNTNRVPSDIVVGRQSFVVETETLGSLRWTRFETAVSKDTPTAVRVDPAGGYVAFDSFDVSGIVMSSVDGVEWRVLSASEAADALERIDTTKQDATSFGYVAFNGPEYPHRVRISVDGVAWEDVEGPPSVQAEYGFVGGGSNGGAGDLIYWSEVAAEGTVLWIGLFEPSTAPDKQAASSDSGLLEAAIARGPVTSYYGDDVQAELAHIDAFVKGMVRAPTPPEPRFDTTNLGTESILIEIDRLALASIGSYADNKREKTVEHPFLAGVQLAGTTHAAAFRIDIGYDGEVVTPDWSLVHTSSYTEPFKPSGFTRNKSFDDNPEANIMLVLGFGQEHVVLGGLPPDAAAVATTLTDGTKLWQRPLAGIAIFLDPNRQCTENGPNTRTSCDGEFTVLDADGSEIFTIVLTPPIQDDTKRDLGFRIGSPGSE